MIDLALIASGLAVAIVILSRAPDSVLHWILLAVVVALGVSLWMMRSAQAHDMRDCVQEAGLFAADICQSGKTTDPNYTQAQANVHHLFFHFGTLSGVDTDAATSQKCDAGEGATLAGVRTTFTFGRTYGTVGSSFRPEDVPGCDIGSCSVEGRRDHYAAGCVALGGVWTGVDHFGLATRATDMPSTNACHGVVKAKCDSQAAAHPTARIDPATVVPRWNTNSPKPSGWQCRAQGFAENPCMELPGWESPPGLDIGLPDSLTGTGGITDASLLSEVERLEGLIEDAGTCSVGTHATQTLCEAASGVWNFALGGGGDFTLGSTTGGVPGKVTKLLDVVRRFSCLKGIGSFSFGMVQDPVEPPDRWVRLLPFRPALAFFGGGFSVAALLPVLKNILGVDLRKLAISMKELCHAKAQEATARGQTVLMGDILESVAPPGSGSWSAGTDFRPTTTESASGVAAQYRAHLTANPVDTSGSLSEAVNRLVHSQVQAAVAATTQIERLLGSSLPSELRANAAVTGVYVERSGTCSVATHKTKAACEGASATWTPGDRLEVASGKADQARYYPFDEGSDSGAEIALESYLQDVDIEALARESLPSRPAAGAAGAQSSTVQGACIDDYAAPVGEAAEGLAGAFRQLRAYSTDRVRKANLGGWICSLLPDFAGQSVGDVCWDWGADMGTIGNADFSGFRHMCIYTTAVDSTTMEREFSATNKCLYAASASATCAAGTDGAMPSWVGMAWGLVSLAVQILAALAVLSMFFSFRGT